MGTEIKELYNALQRFIERRQKMHIPLEQDDDDIMIANAFDELEQLRTENERLREALEKIYTRDCALAVSHEMECHRKDYARELLEGGSD